MSKNTIKVVLESESDLSIAQIKSNDLGDSMSTKEILSSFSMRETRHPLIKEQVRQSSCLSTLQVVVKLNQLI